MNQIQRRTLGYATFRRRGAGRVLFRSRHQILRKTLVVAIAESAKNTMRLFATCETVQPIHGSLPHHRRTEEYSKNATVAAAITAVAADLVAAAVNTIAVVGRAVVTVVIAANPAAAVSIVVIAAGLVAAAVVATITSTISAVSRVAVVIVVTAVHAVAAVVEDVSVCQNFRFIIKNVLEI